MKKNENGMSVPEVVDVANDTFHFMLRRLTRQGHVNDGNLAAAVAMVFKLSFALSEKNEGIDEARKVFNPAFNYMSDTMIVGAWDNENKKVK